MKPFRCLEAARVQEATQALMDSQGRCVVMAGGTDLLGCLKDRILPAYPETVILLQTIPGLDSIQENEGSLVIGAMVRLSDLARSPEIVRHAKVLAQASESVASPQIRNTATLGGNLCQDVRCWYYRYPRSLGGPILCRRKTGQGACPAVAGDNRYHAILGAKKCFAVCPSDTAVALVALDARVRITGPEATRTPPVQDLYTEKGLTLEPGEVLTEVTIPEPPKDTVQVFLKYTLRAPIDFAVASVAAIFTVEGGHFKDARIALGGVASAPLRARKAEEEISGRPVSEETAQKAAAAAVSGARPLKGNGYKVDIVKALVKQALLGNAQETGEG
ncbi:MAG: FAD binding domain-containing protein [Desulfobacteraceae bacterium]|jgi:xanthine dehydrogenase YagS FAD-binding subunit